MSEYTVGQACEFTDSDGNKTWNRGWKVDKENNVIYLDQDMPCKEEINKRYPREIGESLKIKNDRRMK